MALPETPSRATLFLKVHPVANAATNDGRSICVVASVSSEMKSRIRIDLSLPQLLSLYRQIRRNGEARLEMALTASHCFCVPLPSVTVRFPRVFARGIAAFNRLSPAPATFRSSNVAKLSGGCGERTLASSWPIQVFLGFRVGLHGSREETDHEPREVNGHIRENRAPAEEKIPRTNVFYDVCPLWRSLSSCLFGLSVFSNIFEVLDFALSAIRPVSSCLRSPSRP
ncbi:hypothetical protein TGVAND_213748 [Toxoplasma gondii VAND]|uniref:Uncharacterized protein n=2 Tax=Toxoplasma gondii TaxID=5811 RepID=A0A086QDD1_TOXGO|nr:hypothetical protein TGVAND_213748 [Toxoplasma gondii VAND]KFH10613.1 hypothetical protein TGMAS_213748 [Toxoplasma gondii MAS]